MKKYELNLVEIAHGAAFGALLGLFTGPLSACITAAACSVLWAVGGSGAGRAWRFIGVPLTGFLALLVAQTGTPDYLLALSAAAAGGVLTIGYGIPSTQPADSGSTLGRFFYELVGERDHIATLLTRGTLAVALGLVYIPLALVSGYFGWFVIALMALHLATVQFVRGNLIF